MVTNSIKDEPKKINVLIPENIPQELKKINQWVAWKAVPGKNGKTDKIPYDPKSQGMAKANDPKTWGTYEQALDFYFSNMDKLAGVGLELQEKNKLVGVDLDNCFDEDGDLKEWAVSIVEQLDSYTEVSPSGKGIRIFIKGTLPKNGRKKGDFECYTSGRFLTVTGNVVEGSQLTVEDRDKEIKNIHKKIFGEKKKETKSEPRSETTLDDAELIRKAKASKKGDVFAHLWAGSWEGYPSQSDADLALCNILAFWTGKDAARMDSLFRQSGLYREKWNKKHYADGRTYGQATIEKAIAGTSDTYSPRPSAAEDFKPEIVNLTDVGNGIRFARQHKDNARYCWQNKTWYIWDGTRWMPDDAGIIYSKAKKTAKSIYKEAATVDDDELRKAIAKHAVRSEAEIKLRAMVNMAASEDGVPIMVRQFDTHHYLLNCLNGTVDLKTGELSPHKKEHLLTSIAPVKYDPDARSDLFDSFLERVIPDAELRAFVQRAAGYSITGDIGEERLFFPYGPPATGKSTLLAAIGATLGEDFYVTADFESFLAKDKPGNGPRNDIARLHGKRFCVSLEVDDGKKLAEALVNQLTGGDLCSARFMYKESFEFYPTFHLWLAANNRPRINGDDGAIWRRILTIPFNEQIPEEERDPEVKRILRDPEISGPAIMAWLVEGCLMWQIEGLKIPDSVKAATDDYRQEQDVLRDFIAEALYVDDHATCGNSELYEAYQAWSRSVGEKYSLGRKKFTQKMEAKGFDQVRDGSRRYWLGIGIMTNT